MPKKYYPPQKIRLTLKQVPSVENRLVDHLYAPWIERPAWPYIGAQRTDEYGNERAHINFSISKYGWPTSFVWTIDDQAWAVSEGFFLHRSGFQNRVNIIWINRFERDSSDGYASLAELEKRHFERRPLYGRALRFIRQQDEWGFSAAWDDRCQFYSYELTWYKDHRVLKRDDSQLSRYERKMKQAALKRIEVAKEANKHSFASHVRRKYMSGVDKG